jgi:hypothetical protein
MKVTLATLTASIALILLSGCILVYPKVEKSGRVAAAVVVDAETLKPIPGAKVKMHSTRTYGARTDESGRFEIIDPASLKLVIANPANTYEYPKVRAPDLDGYIEVTCEGYAHTRERLYGPDFQRRFTNYSNPERILLSPQNP